MCIHDSVNQKTQKTTLNFHLFGNVEHDDPKQCDGESIALQAWRCRLSKSLD